MAAEPPCQQEGLGSCAEAWVVYFLYGYFRDSVLVLLFAYGGFVSLLFYKVGSGRSPEKSWPEFLPQPSPRVAPVLSTCASGMDWMLNANGRV